MLSAARYDNTKRMSIRGVTRDRFAFPYRHKKRRPKTSFFKNVAVSEGVELLGYLSEI